ncbi:hypothetical protein [Oceanobacillus senegalensis]|uniref:hypothetical protein n=1 Tax=Oceanobacillus senegalensis TaxID=1936063 RepID=UPI000A30555B|nr:hypothetical protein [Oceanobacillus senegalensis]
MDLCPLCNGIEMVMISCPNCQSNMDDHGKVMDYFDDYSAYLDIDMVKMVDGDTKSLENHQCLHYFYCTNCQHEETRAFRDGSDVTNY